MYWPSMQVFKGSELWNKLDKKMKWTFMGKWSLEDSQMYSENPDFKLQQNMAYLNKRKTGFKLQKSFDEETRES
jgi:hypothetical protein